MITVFDKKENCSGCGVCKVVCNETAITMQKDNCGFYYPKIDAKLCVSCKKCRNSCHFVNNYALQNSFKDVFAVQSKDAEILKKSQSGGLFAELAKSILDAGGVIYGAAFNDLFEVCHIRIESENQLYRLQGSKYVQSKTEDVFEMVKNDLNNDVQVLFSGTPCQIAALYSYLGSKNELLYTVDVVCHGVMAQALWKNYLDYIKKRYGEVTHVDFRDKAFGWRLHMETFIVGKRKIVKNIYRKIFHKNILLRPSCYGRKNNRYIPVCKYAGFSRVSDITVGDFWGIKNTAALFKDENLGISLCMINTQTGARLFETIKQNIIYERRDITETLARQPHLSCSDDGVPVDEVEAARQMYIKKGFMYIASRYGENGVRGIYPKGIRYIKHIRNKILRKMGFKTEQGEKQ